MPSDEEGPVEEVQRNGWCVTAFVDRDVHPVLVGSRSLDPANSDQRDPYRFHGSGRGVALGPIERQHHRAATLRVVRRVSGRLASVTMPVARDLLNLLNLGLAARQT
jgi:hypothetical protein